MSSPLADPTIIRAFILHDALLNIPFSEGYINLQKIIGDDVVSYADYDFWYHRFYSGNLDLNYDRSAYPSPPMLEELPIEVLDVILGNLDLKNRFKMRKVSKTMLQVVDQLKTVYSHLRIQCSYNSLCLYIGGIGWDLQYIRLTNGQCKIENGYSSPKIVQGDFLKIGLRDLRILLKSPNLRIDRFDIEDKDSEAFQQVLDTVQAARKSKIHVERAEIKVKNNQHAIALVAMLKPKALENLDIHIPNQKNLEQNILSPLKDMDQFKQSKVVHMSLCGAIPATDLSHFCGFEFFQVLVETMSPTDVWSLRENLSKPDNKTKECYIEIETAADLVEIGRALGKEVDEWDEHFEHTFSIANSNMVLKFEFRAYELNIWKVDATLHGFGHDSDDSDDTDNSDYSFDNSDSPSYNSDSLSDDYNHDHPDLSDYEFDDIWDV